MPDGDEKNPDDSGDDLPVSTGDLQEVDVLGITDPDVSTLADLDTTQLRALDRELVREHDILELWLSNLRPLTRDLEDFDAESLQAVLTLMVPEDEREAFTDLFNDLQEKNQELRKDISTLVGLTGQLLTEVRRVRRHSV